MGAAGAIGGGLALGAYGQYEANKANRRNRRTLGGLKNQQLANLDPALAAQEGYLKRAIREEESGMAADESRFEQRTMQGVEDATQSAIGDATAGLASTGSLGSGLASQVRAGIGRQSIRARTDSQLAISALRGQNRMRRAGNLRELGAFQAYKANARNNILGGYGAQLAGNSYTSQGADLGGLAMLAAMGSGGGGGDPTVTPMPPGMYGGFP